MSLKKRRKLGGEKLSQTATLSHTEALKTSH